LLGITPRVLRDLIWQVGSASEAVRAIAGGVAGSDNDRAFLRDLVPAEVRRRVVEADARFALPGDPEYWPAFARLADPPVGVFLRGRPLRLGHRRVALVGSRRPSRLGVEVARDLGRGVTAAGLVVVSGGAIGIDARAHEAALGVGGTTVAVLGSGYRRRLPGDQPGPAAIDRAARHVGQRISARRAGGTVPFPGAQPAHRGPVHRGCDRRGWCPQRHPEHGGLRGPARSRCVCGPRELIRDGARLIRGPADLLEDLGFEAMQVEAVSLDGLPAAEGEVLAALREPMLPDAVSRAARLSIPETVAALVRLEIRGLVQGNGGRYRRTVQLAAEAAGGPGEPDAELEGGSGPPPSG
jgi:DNA processing protein